MVLYLGKVPIISMYMLSFLAETSCSKLNPLSLVLTTVIPRPSFEKKLKVFTVCAKIFPHKCNMQTCILWLYIGKFPAHFNSKKSTVQICTVEIVLNKQFVILHNTYEGGERPICIHIVHFSYSFIPRLPPGNGASWI